MKEKKIEAVMQDRRCIKMKKIILLCGVLILVNGCSAFMYHRGCYYDEERNAYYFQIYKDGKIVGEEKCN